MTTLFNAVSHASSRRPIALRDEDYDHEINLIDQTSISPIGSRSVEIPRSDDESSITPQTSQTPLSRRHSFDHGRRSSRIRSGIEHKRWSRKWTEERIGERAGHLITDEESSLDVAPMKSAGVRVIVSGSGEGDDNRSGRTKHKIVPSVAMDRSPTTSAPESAIDVLYENERGGFLCGHPLFGSRALGMFDAAPWTNIAFKPSATNIKNAQVPDPGWEWAWDEWVINHDPDIENLDDDGWEYSFMFSKRFSWHGPTWYNSFVRRRAWIRKRVRVHRETETEDPHMLNAEYFAVHPERPSSASVSVSRRSSRREMAQEEEEMLNIDQMLAALKACRIDREKSEVVEAFVKGSKADLKDLAGRMHDVMGMFIFQASRRTLLVHLTTALDETSKEQKEAEEKGEAGNAEGDKRKERLNHLVKAVEAADEEVKRMEYWSDIKGVTEEGLAKGAVDEEQGWDPAWTGLDKSAPRDVIMEAQMPGVDKGPAKRAVGKTDSKPAAVEKKGKGKENRETP